MKQPSRLVGLSSGFVLYAVIIIFLSLMEGWPTIKLFVRTACSRYSVAFLLGEAVLYAAVIFSLAFVWSYAAIRPLSTGKRQATVWSLIGMGVAWLSWIVFSLATGGVEVPFANLPEGLAQPSCYLLPMWSHLGIVVATLGTILAGAQARRGNPSVRRGKKRTSLSDAGENRTNSTNSTE